MGLLMQVLKDEAANISAALFILMMLIIMATSITFLPEHRVQPVDFGSIPAALWWVIVTKTTIDYGDMVPMTVIGKICSAVIGIINLGIVALPAGILPSGFNEALLDGLINTNEHAISDQRVRNWGSAMANPIAS